MSRSTTTRALQSVNSLFAHASEEPRYGKGEENRTRDLSAM